MTEPEREVELIDRMMRTFESVRFDNPDYPDQPGSVLCCGGLVVQRNGVIVCPRCARSVQKP